MLSCRLAHAAKHKYVGGVIYRRTLKGILYTWRLQGDAILRANLRSERYIATSRAIDEIKDLAPSKIMRWVSDMEKSS